MNQSDAKKGFAALNSMVSDVEATVSANNANRPPNPTEDANTAFVERSDSLAAGTSPASEPPSSKTWLWVVPLGFFIALLFILLANTSTSSSSGDEGARSALDTPAAQQSPTPYVPIPTPETPPPVVYAASTQPDRTEMIPPIGVGLELSVAQIRYCLSEKLRIQVWRTRLEAGFGSSLQAFNNSVNDYNARCSNFRYQGNTLTTVRAEVEANRPVLTREALSRARSFESDDASSQAQSEPTPTADSTARTDSTIPAMPPVLTPLQTFTTSFDCSKASADAEQVICHDAELAASDVALASLFARAQAATTDKVAFKQHAREQWNDRQRNCHDRNCLLEWYAKQKEWLSEQANTPSFPPTSKSAAISEGVQPTAALNWAHIVAQHHADSNAAYDLARRSLGTVSESCSDAVLLQQTPVSTASYKPVIMFLSQKCGYIVSYWPESGEEQVSFDRATVERWHGYCSTRTASTTDCVRGNGA
jgi:uncharacterized protein